jgi:hypothetical protein
MRNQFAALYSSTDYACYTWRRAGDGTVFLRSPLGNCGPYYTDLPGFDAEPSEDQYSIEALAERFNK